MKSVGDIVAGRFVLELEAGRGGMGTVFRARDRDGTEVALKLIRAEPSARERALFAREAAALAAQTHAGVVRYLAHGVDAGVPWLAMEWVSGTTLSRRLATGPALSAREVLLLWRRLSRALAAVHAAGIVHRDVKPGNVMLPGGDVLAAKLTDFGVARSTTGAIDALTQTGDVVGTISFMAPEQLMGAREIGAPVDVFALGRLIYECVLGRPAFGGQLPAAVMLRIASEAPAELAEVGRRIGLGAGELLEAMLAKAPLLRPRMAEVSDRLERLIEDGTQRLGDDPISSVTRRERRLDCLVLARIDTTSTEVEVTLDARAPSGLERARRAIDAHGGHGQVLGGTLVSATFDEAESLTE
ncbi:MAG: serine/threonine protein kinase, partial [Sandaracinaceae bacterium]|nr:serine/threonine protein kinase [Sandaracinaceae bacterium]